MKEYLVSPEEVLKEQNSSPEGLSQAEAEKRLEQTGPNKLKEGKKDSLLKKFLKELADPMIIILIVAAAISGVTAFYEGESFWVCSRKARQKPPSPLSRKSPQPPARYSATGKW